MTLERLASQEQDGGSRNKQEQDGGSRNKQTPNVMHGKEDRSATYRSHSELGFM
jgi:hypothetical protein